MMYLLILSALMLGSLAITSRLVKILVYARIAGIKFTELADGLEMHPWRLLIMLLISWGYTPSIQAWLRIRLGIPRSALPKPKWFHFQAVFTAFNRLLFLSGFSGWVWKRERLKALKKEEKDIREYLRRYRLIPLDTNVVYLLEMRIVKIQAEKEEIRLQSKWEKDVSNE